MTAPLLEIQDLSIAFRTEAGPRTVIHRMSLAILPGEILGLVGESGSGKSVTSLAIMRLLGALGSITTGRITLEGRDLVRLDGEAMREVRGRQIAMIFQEPMTSLNPLLRIGLQIEETLQIHLGLRGRQARERGIALLEAVGLPAAASRYDDYPHLLSGGQRQRVMIAMAIACMPRLLIADEPTTALDVTIQAQILALMRKLRTTEGAAILLITHDLGVIAHLADRVAVMYAGEIVELAPVRSLLATPAHPYTRLLLQAIPTTRHRQAQLRVIPGQMPAPGVAVSGCRFRDRCPIAIDRCSTDAPTLDPLTTGRAVRCWRAAEPVQALSA